MPMISKSILQSRNGFKDRKKLWKWRALRLAVITSLTTLVAIAFGGCGENAHITAPTPSPTLRNTYAGDDISNGDYSIAIGATNDTGSIFQGDEKIFVRLDSPDGAIIYFSGEFKMGMDLSRSEPLTTDPRSIQTWTKIQTSLKLGLVVPNGKIVFDKKKWALDSGLDTFYYRLFDTNHRFIEPGMRHAGVPLRLTLSIQNNYGLGHSAEVIMPVRFRYAFDDEALGPAQRHATQSSYQSDADVTSRVIAGLEWVSNSAITSTDSACEAAFHLNYPFDFVDMTGSQHPYAAVATALRSSGGIWNSIFVSRPTILEAIGSALGGSIAAFSDPPDYEGLCYRKVYGFVLTDRFIDLDLSGLRLFVQDGTLSGEAIYGLTKVEAF